MTIADSRVVAWLVLDSHGVPAGADRHEVVVAHHASLIGGSYVRLVRESLLAEAESRIVALQSRLDAVGSFATDLQASMAAGFSPDPRWVAEQFQHVVNHNSAALGCATTGEGGE